jgi:hypothetical protein
MARIGEFEAAAKAADPDREADTFTLNGAEFTVAEDPNIIALGRFARSARAGADSDDMEGLATLVETVASLVIPEDETRFLDTASKHRVDAPLLMRIITAVLEAQSARPTVSPSDSSDGSSKITVSSRVLSSSVESSPRQQSWRDTPFGRRELAAHPELYEGIGSVEENGRSLSSVG